jgi:hypothetical protein
MLGSDGSGNPICVDERDAKIVLLDHELLFDAKALMRRIMLVNSGVEHLAESLLLFNTMAPESSLAAICRIDPPAGEPRTFWFSECRAESGGQKPWWKFW